MGKYTAIDDPSAYFQAATYSGTGSSGNAITNDGNSDLQPDFVWIKVRTYNNDNVLQDSSRGFAGSGEVNVLRSNSTVAEGTNGAFASFDTNGFEVGGTNPASRSYNGSSDTYVAWQWKANGGTTSSNTDGDVTSTVQVNQDAGFSIVTDGPHANTNARTIGHGLGVAPQVVIRRARNRVESWRVFHSSAGSTGSLKLNDSSAYNSSTTLFTGVTSTTFGVGTDFSVNGNYNYISYCFAEKQGYSKFGKYVGNGNANGAFVYTGFKPAWVMIKQSNTARNWQIFDNKRDGYNKDYMPRLKADTSDAETANSGASMDFVSNGFKMRTDQTGANQSGGTYIYMAFAENPFTTSTGIPTTAR
jgi:hypothetical protein